MNDKSNHNILIFSAFTLLLTISGCAPSLEQRKINATPAMEALQSSRFDEALQKSEDVLKEDSENPYAALVHGITNYKKTMHQLFLDAQTMAIGAAVSRNFNSRYLHMIVEEADGELADVADKLDVASRFPELGMDLCLACLEVDWNRNGRVDEEDRVLLQVELDQDENKIPKGDPRRSPTFRFDHGDVRWSQAFVSFQRAVLSLVAAYDWAEAVRILNMDDGEIRIRLQYPENIQRTREQILSGLRFSLQAREAYLAERDDDREWLPNPVQKDHPLPMPVDGALYDTWGVVAGDLIRIVEGKEGLSVSEIAQLGDHQWDDPPRGYIDVGKFLSEPKDIVVNIEDLEDQIDDAQDEEDRDAIEAALKSIFGDYYVMHMKASPLLTRMDRMKREILVGQESLERKLRYLLWVN